MRISAVVVLAILCTTAPLTAQGKGSLELRAQSEAGTPLENTLVSIPAEGASRFTNLGGVVTLANLEPKRVLVQIRRIGFQPRDTTVALVAGTTTSVEVVLARVALRLAAVRVTAQPRCDAPGAPVNDDDAALIAAFEQLRMNASQYIALVHSYPFASLVHSYYGYQKHDSAEVFTHVDSAVISGIPRWRYAPGRVVTRQTERGRRGEFFMHLPTVEVFADSVFIANHCFHNGGVATLKDSSYFLIDFAAASTIRTPDIEGTIYLHPVTLQVRRTVLRLTAAPPIRMMTGLEVTTDFAEVARSIPIINRVYSRQTFDSRAAVPVLFEEQRLMRVQFHGARPAGRS
jgi:hypothetical protein